MTIVDTKFGNQRHIDIEGEVPGDAYSTIALLDVRSMDLLKVYLKNAGSNSLKFKIQGSRKNKDVAAVADADFTRDIVAETTLTGGSEANSGEPYAFYPRGTYTFIRVQHKNGTAGQANSTDGYVKAYA